jgi:Ca-activated chloride channel family protein
MVGLVAVLTLFITAGLFQGLELQDPQQEPPKDKPFTFSAGVDLVVLGVTVVDSRGGFVSGLVKENYSVYENGQPQKIEYFHQEDLPVTVGLVIDNSGSMIPRRSDVISAAIAFVHASNRLDQMFVVTFNDQPKFALAQDEPFTSSAHSMRTALIQDLPAGQTALYDAVATALVHSRKGYYDRKALLVVSDGSDNVSQLKFDQLLELTKHSDATIYTIALFDETNPNINLKVLKKLAQVSGGEFFAPSSLSHVGSVCRQIAKDIRNQYTLAYSPSSPMRDGSYRNIKVLVQAPGRQKVLVRTREGYYASPKATISDSTRQDKE